MTAGGKIAFIGIGSNLDDPPDRCREALERLSQAPGIRMVAVSSFYRTEPVGRTDQPDFVNAVAEIRTTLSARALLDTLQAMERGMGRYRVEEDRWGPRVIDLDILLYGQEVLREPGISLPHPQCHLRRFVLEPLCEIAPHTLHPVFGISARGLLDRLSDGSRIERLVSDAGP